MEDLIRYQAEGPVVTLTLARPDKLNAFTRPMLKELDAALDAAAADASLRVMVLTGAGRAFGTGQDLTDPATGDIAALLTETYDPLVRKLFDHPLVTIAALNGLTVGAAASLALACDIAVAAEGATISQAFVRIGLMPDAGGTWFLPRIVGLRNAMALALTGDTITAPEAQAMGLVYRVFKAEDLAVEVKALATRLAGHSPSACRMIKQGLRASLGNTLTEQLAVESRLQGQLAETAEFAAAVAAFRQRRKSG